MAEVEGEREEEILFHPSPFWSWEADFLWDAGLGLLCPPHLLPFPAATEGVKEITKTTVPKRSLHL